MFLHIQHTGKISSINDLSNFYKINILFFPVVYAIYVVTIVLGTLDNKVSLENALISGIEYFNEIINFSIRNDPTRSLWTTQCILFRI